MAVFPQKIARPWARAEGYLSLDIPSDVRVQIGLRNTHLWVQNQLSRLQWNPAIRLQWPFYRSLALRLQASRHHQTPSTYTLLADPEGAYIQLPRSDSFSAALGWKSDSAEFQLEGFAKSLAHLPLREEDGTLGQFSGQTWGIEAFGKAQFSNWSRIPECRFRPKPSERRVRQRPLSRRLGSWDSSGRGFNLESSQ